MVNGSLPNGLTVEDMKNGTSMPRNMFLFTNANYLLPYTGAGSGVRRALEYDPDVVFTNGINDKEITHSANEFVITIPRKAEQVTNQGNLVTDPAQSETDPTLSKADPVSDPAIEKSATAAYNAAKLKLSKKQQDIRNYCSIPRNRQEILQRAGVTDHFDNRKKYIYDLVQAGILERTIPDKPNDPNQKYRRKQ